MQCALCYALCVALYALQSMQCTLCNAHYAVHTTQCALMQCILCYALYVLQSMLNNVRLTIKKTTLGDYSAAAGGRNGRLLLETTLGDYSWRLLGGGGRPQRESCVRMQTYWLITSVGFLHTYALAQIIKHMRAGNETHNRTHAEAVVGSERPPLHKRKMGPARSRRRACLHGALRRVTRERKRRSIANIYTQHYNQQDQDDRNATNIYRNILFGPVAVFRCGAQ